MVELDAKNLLCPLPVIRVQNQIKTMSTGEVLKVICTDPGALHDVPAWCRVHGHTILSDAKEDNEIIIEIQVN